MIVSAIQYGVGIATLAALSLGWATLGAQPSDVSITVDFETPVLDADTPRERIDPYDAEGLRFTALSERYDDATLGLVKNRESTACVGTDGDAQLLGTGRRSLPNFIGKGAFAVRADVDSVPAPADGSHVRISATFQTLAGSELHLELLGPDGETVASVNEAAEGADDACRYPGDSRARTTVSATAERPVQAAVMDVVEEGHVFVLDDVVITVPEASGSAVGLGRVAELPDWAKLVVLIGLFLTALLGLAGVRRWSAR